jgi:hypothetical protein
MKFHYRQFKTWLKFYFFIMFAIFTYLSFVLFIFAYLFFNF